MSDFPHDNDGIDARLRQATPRPTARTGRIREWLVCGAIGVLVGLALGLVMMGGV